MNTYEITEVDEASKEAFCTCFEDWSDEIREAGDHKLNWYDRLKDEGIGVKLIRDTDGTLCGHIQYVPAEYAPLTGDNFYFIYCIWVHAHKKGIGDRRGAGMGTALLKAAEEDIRNRGASGVAAWGISMPFWMKASWYRKHGYRVIQRDGMRRLLWKPFTEGAELPQWYSMDDKPESLEAEGRVLVTSFVNGICPVTNLAHERAKAVVSEFGDDVVFSSIETTSPDAMNRWRTSDALFINKTEIVLGPPLSKKKIRSVIRMELKKAAKARK